MRGKPDVGNFPACGSPGLVTPGLRRRRAYRRAYVASPRLTTTDVGLTPRLANARVVHTAPALHTMWACGNQLTIAVTYRLTHTQTHPFNGPFFGTTRVSQYQKG